METSRYASRTHFSDCSVLLWPIIISTMIYLLFSLSHVFLYTMLYNLFVFTENCLRPGRVLDAANKHSEEKVGNTFHLFLTILLCPQNCWAVLLKQLKQLSFQFGVCQLISRDCMYYFIDSSLGRFGSWSHRYLTKSHSHVWEWSSSHGAVRWQLICHKSRVVT